MNLFICGTSYQLLNAISIIISTKEKADLVIIRKSIVESCNINYLQSLGYFSNIYVWTELFEKVSFEHVRYKMDIVVWIMRIAQSMVNIMILW